MFKGDRLFHLTSKGWSLVWLLEALFGYLTPAFMRRSVMFLSLLTRATLILPSVCSLENAIKYPNLKSWCGKWVIFFEKHLTKKIIPFEHSLRFPSIFELKRLQRWLAHIRKFRHQVETFGTLEQNGNWWYVMLLLLIGYCFCIRCISTWILVRYVWNTQLTCLLGWHLTVGWHKSLIGIHLKF